MTVSWLETFIEFLLTKNLADFLEEEPDFSNLRYM